MSERECLSVIYVGSAVAANFLKGLLEGAGIRVFLWGNHVSGSIVGALGGVKVAIATQDLGKAKPVVKAFIDQGLFEHRSGEDPGGLPW